MNGTVPMAEVDSHADRKLRHAGSRRGPGGDRQGTTTVEFALISLPLMIFFFSIVYVAMHFYEQQSLDYAVQQAARQVEIGAIGTSYTPSDFVNKVLCTNFGPSCANLTVDLHPVADYTTLTNASAVDAPDSIKTSGFQFCVGGPGQMMYAHVVYTAPSPLASLLGLPAADTMVANAAFINENPGGVTVVPSAGC